MADATTTLSGPAAKALDVDSERRTKWLFIAPAVLYLMVLSLFPFIYSVYLSLYDAKLTAMHRKWFVGLENYERLLTDPVFLQAIQNTGGIRAGFDQIAGNNKFIDLGSIDIRKHPIERQ